MLALEFGQSAVDEVDGDGSFADGGGDAFHVARANIADGENAGKAGFQHLRRSGARGQRGSDSVIDIPAREDEALVIEGDATAAANRCAETRRP